ncbi:MAG: chemotaxis protein CheX [Candidatus Acidiferrum sp.]|jgi:chemotaxis protein CheX
MTPLMSPAKARVQFDPHWKTVLEMAALEVFELMAGARPDVNTASTEVPHGGQTAIVGLAGALCGMTTVRCSKETASRLASLMLGEDAAASPTTSRDALGELCNMIAGNFKAKISNVADYCMLSVPTVITGDDYTMEVPESTLGFTVALALDGQPIWITLVTHP